MPKLLLTQDKKTNRILLFTYFSYIGLLILLTFTFIQNDDHSWKLWAFQMIPLLLVLPAMLKRYYRAHSWLCFIILAYFTAYVVEVGSPLAELTDWIGLLFSIGVFTGAMMSSRQLQRIEPE